MPSVLLAALRSCRHTTQRFDCCTAAPFSCGGSCGRPLQCGNHHCALPCHAVADALASTSAAPYSSGAVQPQACQQCSLPCSKARACEHVCSLNCHPGPCPPCTQPVTRPCHCGKTSLKLECHAAVQLERSGGAGCDDASAAGLCCGRPCHKPLSPCMHPCRELCHSGPCPGATNCK